MSRDLIRIHNTDIESIEHDGQRVITLDQMDQVHGRPKGTARRNFNQHKQRMEEGRHYFRCDVSEAGIVGRTAPNGLLLLTESGYLILIKTFRDRLASEVLSGTTASYFDPSFSLDSIITERESSENDGFVYVINSEGNPLYKIGLSKNPTQRLESLQHACPIPLTFRFLWRTSDMNLVEKCLHKRFETKRKHGEWFKLDSLDLHEIEQLMTQPTSVLSLHKEQQEMYPYPLSIEKLEL